MGLGNWIDKLNANGQLKLARKSLKGLSLLATIDRASYLAVAQNVAVHLEEVWPRNGVASLEYLTAIRSQLERQSGDKLFDLAYATLKYANKVRPVLAMRAEALALVAHWVAMMSMAKGNILQDDAAAVSEVYTQAFADLITLSDTPSDSGETCAAPRSVS